MNKPIKMVVAVFLALGSMISFSPRESRAREMSIPEDNQCGVGRHFVATWEYLSRAVLRDAK